MWLNDYECFVNTLCANDRVELDWIEYNSDLAEIFVKRYGGHWPNINTRLAFEKAEGVSQWNVNL